MSTGSAPHFELLTFDNAEAIARAAAVAWVDEVATALEENRAHHTALSGGRIAQTLFHAMTTEVRARKASVEHAHFFWADERCVPPGDPESNFRTASEFLLKPLDIAPERAHRIRGELTPESAAQIALDELRKTLVEKRNGQPVLDLVILGLGEDGHVASLFPGEQEEVVRNPASYRPIFNSPKPPAKRVTLGYPAIAAARRVWMLASGNGKGEALRESLLPHGRTPFARVLKERSQTRIFTDISVA